MAHNRSPIYQQVPCPLYASGHPIHSVRARLYMSELVMVFQTGRRMLHRLVIIALTLISVFASDRTAAQEAIGTVSRIQGEASGTRGSTTRPLGLNAPLILNETVSTGATARLEVTFRDYTRLTLGENAKLTLDSYAFNPPAGRGKIRFRVVGAFRFVSASYRSWRAPASL